MEDRLVWGNFAISFAIRIQMNIYVNMDVSIVISRIPMVSVIRLK